MEQLCSKLGYLIIAAMLITFAGCGKSNDTPATDETKKQTEAVEQKNDGNEIVDRFKQLGVDLEKLKPNVATLNRWSWEDIDDIIKVCYVEKSDNGISKEVGLSYNQKMFDYTKTIAEDGKNYFASTNKNWNEEKTAVDNSGYTTDYTWSYKYNGKWYDVYMKYNTNDSKTIGIQINIGTQH